MSSNNGDQQKGITRAISESSSSGGEGTRMINGDDWDYDPSNITSSGSGLGSGSASGSGSGSASGSGQSSEGHSNGGKVNSSSTGGSYYKYGNHSF